MEIRAAEMKALLEQAVASFAIPEGSKIQKPECSGVVQVNGIVPEIRVTLNGVQPR